MVFYRKYRPQTIEDLDNNKVRETLYSVLSGDSVPHAFLFTGPKGLGKTSAARIVAKAINCETRIKNKDKKNSQLKTHNSQLLNIEPCNKCSQCISITNGNNLDVLEIDGASNRGIDEIRDLRDKIRLSPVSAKKKVYIIDEVHMLTTEAFNALLKTLEEPPVHALFILCTTEPHKVPPTIKSRCFHVSFTLATKEELVRSFSRIIKGEKLLADNEALLEIASLSDGSFRDGTKILEEMVSISNGKKITKELVEKKYQISNISHQVSEMIDLLTKKDTKAGLQLVGKLVEQGIDIKYFIGQIIDYLHELLLIKVGVKTGDSKNESLEIIDIKTLVDLFTKANAEMKYTVLPQLPLEMVIVEWGIGAEVGNENFLVRNAKKDISSNTSSEPAKANSENFVTSPRPSDSQLNNQDILQQLIEKLKVDNFSVAGVLRGCRVSRYDSKDLVIETAYKFHKEKLEKKETLELLKDMVKEIAGEKIKISIILKEKVR